ncbi:MAG: terpene cyclase/mutase family protein [Actinomycetota bacterium]|nr:terpene cyclase/mutase family protein [Actinomycetota bacterium]
MRLTGAEVGATAAWIESLQRPNGMIPWFPGGHADPWNHIEAAMALALAGRTRAAERALGWLASSQNHDGSWFMYYLADGVEDRRRDTNVSAYVATGAWWHYVVTGDRGVLAAMWPVIDRAIDFVLRLQQPGGEIVWSIEPDGSPGRFALLSGSSSIHHSLRCAVASADVLGHDRPEWELAAGHVAHAVAEREDAFEPKVRWAMDWYYPVLCGAVSGPAAQARLLEGWPVFVMEDLGVRCVSDQPWVTAAETAECVMALDACGLAAEARALLDWTRHLRDDDGAYWTGCVHPQCVRFPGGERSTYTAAAVLLADHVLYGDGPSAGLFRGETLPAVLHLPEVERAVGDGS